MIPLFGEIRYFHFTHRGLTKMADILQAAFSNVVSSVKKFEFRLNFIEICFGDPIDRKYSTSQKNFAVGRPSPADRSEPLIAACRFRPVTAESGRLG